MSKLIAFTNDLLTSNTLQKDFLEDPEGVMKQRGLNSQQIAMLKTRNKSEAIKGISDELSTYEAQLKQTHRNSW